MVVKKALNIILKSVITIVLIVLLFFSAFQIISRLKGEAMPSFMGYSYAVIVSGSMEPALNVYDVIIVKNTENNKYKKGDVIAFFSPYDNEYITHRITGKQNGDYITKGDNNNIEDMNLVKTNQIKGKVIHVIPKWGKVIFYLQSPIVIIALIFVGFLLLQADKIKEHLTKEKA